MSLKSLKHKLSCEPNKYAVTGYDTRTGKSVNIPIRDEKYEKIEKKDRFGNIYIDDYDVSASGGTTFIYNDGTSPTTVRIGNIHVGESHTIAIVVFPGRNFIRISNDTGGSMNFNIDSIIGNVNSVYYSYSGSVAPGSIITSFDFYILQKVSMLFEVSNVDGQVLLSGNAYIILDEQTYPSELVNKADITAGAEYFGKIVSVQNKDTSDTCISIANTVTIGGQYEFNCVLGGGNLLVANNTGLPIKYNIHISFNGTNSVYKGTNNGGIIQGLSNFTDSLTGATLKLTFKPVFTISEVSYLVMTAVCQYTNTPIIEPTNELVPIPISSTNITVISCFGGTYLTGGPNASKTIILDSLIPDGSLAFAIQGTDNQSLSLKGFSLANSLTNYVIYNFDGTILTEGTLSQNQTAQLIPNLNGTLNISITGIKIGFIFYGVYNPNSTEVITGNLTLTPTTNENIAIVQNSITNDNTIIYDSSIVGFNKTFNISLASVTRSLFIQNTTNYTLTVNITPAVVTTPLLPSGTLTLYSPNDPDPNKRPSALQLLLFGVDIMTAVVQVNNNNTIDVTYNAIFSQFVDSPFVTLTDFDPNLLVKLQNSAGTGIVTNINPTNLLASDSYLVLTPVGNNLVISNSIASTMNLTIFSLSGIQSKSLKRGDKSDLPFGSFNFVIITPISGNSYSVTVIVL